MFLPGWDPHINVRNRPSHGPWAASLPLSRYSRFTVVSLLGTSSRCHLLTTFNHLKQKRGSGARGWWECCSGMNRRARTPRGVWWHFWDLKRFPSSLFQGAFCSGFVCHIREVSWEAGFILSWERGLFSSRSRLRPTVKREKVLTGRMLMRYWGCVPGVYRAVYTEGYLPRGVYREVYTRDTHPGRYTGLYTTLRYTTQGGILGYTHPGLSPP